MNDISYKILYEVAMLTTRIAHYFNDKFTEEFYRREFIAEVEFNKSVADFYENGKGCYGGGKKS